MEAHLTYDMYTKKLIWIYKALSVTLDMLHKRLSELCESVVEVKK